MNIRIIKESEHTQMLQLREEVLRKPIGLSLQNEDLSDELYQIKLGAFNEHELIACLLLKPLDKNTLKLRQMAVDSTKQGKGIGSKLVQAAEKYALKHNYTRIELNARISAQNFYKNLGYEVINEQVFKEVGIDHLFMGKDLVC